VTRPFADGAGANADCGDLCRAPHVRPGNEDITVDEVDEQLTEKQRRKSKVLGDEGEKEVRCQRCAAVPAGDHDPHACVEQCSV